MQCPQCKAPLMVAKSEYKSEVDSTDVYNVLTMVCINPKCDNYAGKDLKKPLKIAETVRNKVN